MNQPTWQQGDWFRRRDLTRQTPKWGIGYCRAASGRNHASGRGIQSSQLRAPLENSPDSRASLLPLFRLVTTCPGLVAGVSCSRCIGRDASVEIAECLRLLVRILIREFLWSFKSLGCSLLSPSTPDELVHDAATIATSIRPVVCLIRLFLQPRCGLAILARSQYGRDFSRDESPRQLGSCR